MFILQTESSPCYLLTVRVIRARNLHRTDALSQSDCYVTLWLPTASAEKFWTKTINNCKDPVWNETFYYRIQSQIKNVLELGVYDEDDVTQDDHLFTVRFDVAKLPLGERVLMYFKSDPQVMYEITGRAGSSCPTKFHYVKYKQPALDVILPKQKPLTTCNMCACVFPGLCSSSEDLDVRLGFDLCTEEQDFLCKRKNYVAAALKKVLQLEEDLQDDEIPVVAIMTTGGGMRSLTTTYGSLLGLKKLNVIDCAMYLTGLSGTTWTMANLYRDADWSQQDLSGKINEARKHVTKCKMGSFSMERMKYYNKQLCQRKQEGHRTSSIDLWGLIVEYLLHDGKDNHKLSDQRQAVDQGQNPLPIYVAINVKDNYSTLDFKGKDIPEMYLILNLGGGSVLLLLFIIAILGAPRKHLSRQTNPLVTSFAEEEPVLPMRPHEQKTQVFTTASPLSRVLRGAITERTSVAQYHSFLKGLQLHNDYLENDKFCRWKDTVLDTSPNQLTETAEYLSLIDTGFFINTSCPPLLRPERKVDVILHLNYSPLDQSCKYYSEQGIPFPKVALSEEERKNLKECYLFDDAETPGAPILLFFPLVNDTYQSYKAPGVKRSSLEMEEGKVDLTSRFSPYSTYSVTYKEQDYDQLVKLTEYNILNNKHLILQALRTAVERQKRHKK
uniref:Phospholipase A2 n=1 Tax=Terrapene triunguis TaxID=2587831 RepID=A0A674JGX8_9SAUR